MTFVYIIISSKKDYYAEQALVSIYSLRKNNPKVKILILTDKDTYKTKEETFSRIKEFEVEVREMHLPKELNLVRRSRYIKTKLPDFLNDDFLYLDNDTIVTEDISDIENIECKIGIVYNQHKKDWSDCGLHPMLNLYHKETGIEPEIDGSISDFFNAGIILVRKSDLTKSFFQKWHELWNISSSQYNYHKDQPDLWRANFLFGNLITSIDGIWNCQLLYPGTSMPFFYSAKILHYFSSNDFFSNLFIKKTSFFKGISGNGLSEQDKRKIDDIKNEFMNSLKITLLENLEVTSTPMAVLGKKISIKYPVSNSLANFISKIFKIDLNSLL